MSKAFLALAAVLATALAGCRDEGVPGADADGRGGLLDLRLDFDPQPLRGPGAPALSGSRSAGDDLTEDDLTLTLTHSLGAQPPRVFTLADYDEGQRHVTGPYTLEAEYGTEGQEGWDLPRYYGKQELVIKNETSTPVDLPVTMANARLSLTTSEAFDKFLADCKVTVTTGSGSTFDWDESSGRDLYVNPGQVMVSVSFTKPGGLKGTADIEPFTAQARHAYTVSIDADLQAQTLTLTFDDTLEQKEIDLDISDANLPSLQAAPVILTEGFTPGESLTLVEGNPATSTLKATVAARGTIATAVLTTSSPSLQAKGWPAQVDLASPGTAQATLESLGFKTLGLSGNKDVFAVIDLTAVIPNLSWTDGADNTSTFSLAVTDTQGKTTESQLLSIVTERLVLEFQPESQVTAAGRATVFLEYNGGNPSSIKLWAKNNRGTEDALPFSVTSTSGTHLELTLESPLITLDTPLSIRAEAAGVKTGQFQLKVPALVVSQAQTNVFATHAYATVTFNDAEAAAQKDDVTIQVSSDGGATFTAKPTTLESASRSRAGLEKAVYHITGLTAGTTYAFRAVLPSEIGNIEPLLTESAAQLPALNYAGNIEASGSYWKRYSFGPAWGTNNTMSTADGAIYAYVRISGTVPDDNAILLRTCGWGSGNTATGSKGTSGTCHYTDPGLLHIGSERTSRPSGYSKDDNLTNKCSTGPLTTYDLDCGAAFSSRPASMTFNYRYSPKNSGDKGYVEITLKDAAGNVICTNTANLDASSSYTACKLSLTYSSSSSAVATVYVKFLSSYAVEYVQRTDANFSGPGMANLSNGTFMGSQLWIKDITLNY